MIKAYKNLIVLPRQAMCLSNGFGRLRAFHVSIHIEIQHSPPNRISHMPSNDLCHITKRPPLPFQYRHQYHQTRYLHIIVHLPPI